MQAGKLYRVQLRENSFQWELHLSQVDWVPKDDCDVPLRENVGVAFNELNAGDIFLSLGLKLSHRNQKEYHYMYLLFQEKWWFADDPIEVLEKYYVFERVS